MRHNFFTAIFTLCLAATVTIIPVRASEVPQDERPGAVAEAAAEETAAPGEDEAAEDPQDEMIPAQEAAPEETKPAEEIAQEETKPAEEAAPEETKPAEEIAPEEAKPAEETAPEEAAPAEETAPEEEQTAEEAALEEEQPAEEAAQEGTEQTADAQTEGTEAGISPADAETPAMTAEAATASDQTPEGINAAVGTERAVAESALEKTSAASTASNKVKQMKLEVIDYNDQGYGDSQMLTSGEKRLLIDTYVKESWNTVNRWLKNHGYLNFDIYLSHYHDDHMDNIRRILNDGAYKVTNLYLPDFSYMNGPSEYMQDYIGYCERMIDLAKEKGVKITYLVKGSSFTVGDVNATVLWGAKYKSSEHKRSYINNNSLVTRFTCGNTRYLNAGDIETDSEREILNAKVDVKADIYKLTHHGIDDANSDAFLKAVGASFYYYNSCQDSPSKYSVDGSMSYYSARNAKKYGNVASVRYNGDITYTVYDNIITQKLSRNYTEQKVYLYDKSDKKKLKGVVTQQLNNATTKRIDDRAYDGYSASAAKRAGTYAEDGWVLGNEGNQYYYKDNAPLTGWKKIDGSLYHFNTKTAKKDTGWKNYGGYTFFFNGAGKAQIGNVKIGKSLYHFDDNARLVKGGWASTDGKKCYVSPKTGTVLTGLKKVGGKLYYFDSKGYLIKHAGFIKLGGKVYYECKDGSMKTGWLRVNGKTYYMNADGTRRTGWMKKGGKLFYFEANGAIPEEHGFVTIGKKVFYRCSDGSMKTGWLKADGKTYYMNADGSRHTRWLTIGSRKFYFGSNGVMKTA